MKKSVGYQVGKRGAFGHKYTVLVATSHQEDDPFGYAMQGFLHAEPRGYLGGWIVVNKSSGEIAIVEVSDWSQDDKADYSRTQNVVSKY